MNIEAYITGIFPRDDILIKTWKAYEAGRVSPESFKEVLADSINKIVDVQVRKGFTYIHDPQIDWHDYFRPFTNLDHIEAGPLTRFFENNTFYRKPIFKAFPKYIDGLMSDSLHAGYMPKGFKWIVSIPGPYTFYRLSTFDKDVDPIEAIKEVLTHSIEEIKSLGYSKVIFHEPSIAYDAEVDQNILYNLYEAFKKYSGMIRVHMYFGDISGKIELIRELQIEGFSVDLQYTSLNQVACVGKRYVLGVVDGQNTLPEDLDDIKSKVDTFIKRCNVPISLTNNVDLEYLPYDKALEKVDILSKLYRRFL